MVFFLFSPCFLSASQHRTLTLDVSCATFLPYTTHLMLESMCDRYFAIVGKYGSWSQRRIALAIVVWLRCLPNRVIEAACPPSLTMQP